MATFQEIIDQCWKTAEDTGWHDSPFNWSVRMGNVHSEISEAFDAHRKGGQEPTRIWYSRTDRFNGNYVLLRDVTIIQKIELATIPDYWPFEKPPKPEGVPAELADALIWLFDACRIRDIQIEDTMDRQIVMGGSLPQRTLYEVQQFSVLFAEPMHWLDKQPHFPSDITLMHAHLSAIQEYPFEDTDNIVHQQIARFIWFVLFVARNFNIDLEKAITEKLVYNAYRDYRHGDLPY